MKIRTASVIQENALEDAGYHLRRARFFAKYSDCPKLVAKIRSAIKSHGGATRHMRHRLIRTSK